MKSIRLDLEKPGAARVDWNRSRSDLQSAAQKVAILATTKRGSNRFLTDIGTDMISELSSLNVFDFLSIQHALNFAALKTLKDAGNTSAGPEDDIQSVQMSLIDVKESAAQVAIVVTNAAGKSTSQITEV